MSERTPRKKTGMKPILPQLSLLKDCLMALKDVPVDYIIALSGAIYELERARMTPAEKAMDERIKILSILEPGKDDETIKRVEAELQQLFRENYRE